MMTLIGWIGKQRTRMSLGRNSSAGVYSGGKMANRLDTLRASIKSLLALLIVIVICQGIRLNDWSASFSAKLWSLLPWKPALVNKAFHRLLLVQVELEQRFCNFAELLFVLTVSDGSLETFQLKEATGGKGHNGEKVKTAMEQEAESPVFSRLSFYCVSEIPNILAIVRYSASNDHDQIMAVAEDMFFDNEEDYARLQYEVEDALLTGVDVAMLSHHEPEYFPTIWSYLADDTAV